jgi:hypothetical protein
VTGTRLHDYGCIDARDARVGAKELRLYGEQHRFIPALAAEVGARIIELPVHHRPRTAGRSKYGLSRTLRVMLDLLTVKFLSGYSTRPIHLFGLVGLLCALAGLGLVGALGFQRIVFGVPLANRPIVLLGILMVVVGVQFVSIGLLGEMLVRTYHESQTKPVYRVREIIEPAEAKRVRAGRCAAVPAATGLTKWLPAPGLQQLDVAIQTAPPPPNATAQLHQVTDAACSGRTDSYVAQPVALERLREAAQKNSPPARDPHLEIRLAGDVARPHVRGMSTVLELLPGIRNSGMPGGGRSTRQPSSVATPSRDGKNDG